MAFFAVLQDNTVINVIEADTLEIAETATGKHCVKYTEESPAGIGWLYENDAFIQPVVELDDKPSSEV